MKYTMVWSMIVITALFTSAAAGMSQLIGTSYAQGKACPEGEKPVDGKCITEPIPGEKTCPAGQQLNTEGNKCVPSSPPGGPGGGATDPIEGEPTCPEPAELVDGKCQSQPGKGPGSLQ
jgi:hypothetical protein